jgi:DNA/RNA-binding domain of Phe-tRNA-synthetase-like protein
MNFRHAAEIRQDFPSLIAGALLVEGIRPEADPNERIAHYDAIARTRLSHGNEGEFPEIQAWRRAFSRMGLKPTQYRCASEALLRRLRQEGSLPRLHPLVDLCNAVSAAFAIPAAVIDLARISGDLEVRRASGTEAYLAFSGETEHPAEGEVIFADSAGRAHARRWTNRQSLWSAIRPETTAALIVTEALHDGAERDMRTLVAALAEELGHVCAAPSRSAILTEAAPGFAF